MLQFNLDQLENELFETHRKFLTDSFMITPSFVSKKQNLGEKNHVQSNLVIDEEHEVVGHTASECTSSKISEKENGFKYFTDNFNIIASASESTGHFAIQAPSHIGGLKSARDVCESSRKRYQDPQSREALVDRLLREHAHKLLKSSASSPGDQTVASLAAKEPSCGSRRDSASHESVSTKKPTRSGPSTVSSFGRPRLEERGSLMYTGELRESGDSACYDAGEDDILFFASDLLTSCQSSLGLELGLAEEKRKEIDHSKHTPILGSRKSVHEANQVDERADYSEGYDPVNTSSATTVARPFDQDDSGLSRDATRLIDARHRSITMHQNLSAVSRRGLVEGGAAVEDDIPQPAPPPPLPSPQPPSFGTLYLSALPRYDGEDFSSLLHQDSDRYEVSGAWRMSAEAVPSSALATANTAACAATAHRLAPSTAVHSTTVSPVASFSSFGRQISPSFRRSRSRYTEQHDDVQYLYTSGPTSTTMMGASAELVVDELSQKYIDMAETVRLLREPLRAVISDDSRYTKDEVEDRTAARDVWDDGRGEDSENYGSQDHSPRPHHGPHQASAGAHSVGKVHGKDGKERDGLRPSSRTRARPSTRVEELSRPRTEVLERREAMRRKNEEARLKECTFRPAANPLSSKIASNMSRASVCNRSWDAPVMRGAGEEGEGAKEADAEEGNGEKGLSQPTKEKTAEDLYTRLHSEAEQRAVQLNWLRKHLYENSSAEFPYRPTVNPSSGRLSESLDYRPLHERIGEVLKIKDERQNQLELQHERRVGKELVFKPTIDPRSKILAEKRASKIQHALGGDLDNSTSSAEPKDRSSPRRPGQPSQSDEAEDRGDSNCGVKTSDERGRKQGFVDVVSRLEAEARYSKMRQRELVAIRERELEKITKPSRVSQGTEVLAKSSPIVRASFADRQVLHAERLRVKSEARKQEEKNLRSSWYHPKICEVSEQIVEACRGGETADQRFVRLSREGGEIQVKKKTIEQQVYGSMKFSPVIDPVSKALARPSSIDELVSNPRGQRARHSARKRYHEEEAAICTFRPKTLWTSPRRRPRSANAAYDHHHHHQSVDESLFGDENDDYVDYSKMWACGCPLEAMEEFQRRKVVGDERSDGKSSSRRSTSSINFRNPERMLKEFREKQQEKERLRQVELSEREAAELKECTFEPKPSRAPPDNLADISASVPVPGMERFLQTRDLAARLRLEHQHRVEQAFERKGGEKFRVGVNGTTVAEPFKLSERSERYSPAVKALVAREKGELTFQPRVGQRSRPKEEVDFVS